MYQQENNPTFIVKMSWESFTCSAKCIITLDWFEVSQKLSFIKKPDKEKAKIQKNEGFFESNKYTD